MERKKLVFLGIIFFVFSFNAFAQSTKAKEKESFIVYGNCGMCENKIEGAAKSIDGVVSANWNAETKKMKLVYYSPTTDLETIKKEIAKVGYDTEEFRADDEVYNNLHKCCKYDRPPALKGNEITNKKI